jgi:phospholipid/cholesterol/gamma-HCH transport system substrate-binding protein
VEADGDGAVLKVALSPDMVDRIPADVTAEIAAPTVFGAKYVALNAPAGPVDRPIAAGAVITADTVSVEANTLLNGLLTLLGNVDVAHLNSALGAISTSLNGRGNQLGELGVQLNDYLTKFNPSLPALGRDLSGTADVANNLADVAPDLLAVLDNLSVTSSTVVDERPALNGLLSDLITVGTDTRTLLEQNEGSLRDSLSTLRPTSALLARYSVIYPCLFASVNEFQRDIEPVIGGQLPGIHIFTSLMAGSAGYRYPENLPKIDTSAPPSCYGGPLHKTVNDKTFPYVRVDDGSPTYTDRDDDVAVAQDPLPVLLFGDSAKGLTR